MVRRKEVCKSLLPSVSISFPNCIYMPRLATYEFTHKTTLSAVDQLPQVLVWSWQIISHIQALTAIRKPLPRTESQFHVCYNFRIILSLSQDRSQPRAIERYLSAKSKLRIRCQISCIVFRRIVLLLLVSWQALDVRLATGFDVQIAQQVSLSKNCVPVLTTLIWLSCCSYTFSIQYTVYIHVIPITLRDV